MKPVEIYRTSRPTAAAVTAAEANPAGGAAGVGCDQYSKCSVSFHTLTNITDYSLLVWVYDGTEWAQAADSSNAVINIDTLTTTFSQLFSVAGFSRIFVQIDAITTPGSPSVTRQYALSSQ